MGICKLLIFDLDGTLYDLNDVHSSNYQMQVEFLSRKKNISKEESISILKQNHVYPIIRKDSKSATELFLQMGLDKKEWSDYRDKGFNVDRIDKSKAVDENIIEEFSNLAIVVLLSSNAYPVIEKVLNHINISSSIFDDIVCSDRFPYNMPFKKKLAMESWALKYNVRHEDIISIGDRFETDIKPVLELGGTGILISKPSSLRTVLSDMKNNALQSCDDYKFYLAS